MTFKTKSVGHPRICSLVIITWSLLSKSKFSPFFIHGHNFRRGQVSVRNTTDISASITCKNVPQILFFQLSAKSTNSRSKWNLPCQVFNDPLEVNTKLSKAEAGLISNDSSLFLELKSMVKLKPWGQVTVHLVEQTCYQAQGLRFKLPVPTCRGEAFRVVKQ